MTMLDEVVPAVPTVLNHSTHLFGTVNGTPFDLLGTGVGRPHEGQLDTRLSSTMGAVGFPMHILSPIAIMGYPTYSHYQSTAFDMFKPSYGYRYSRRLQFSCGGTMRTEHDIVRTPEGLQGEFEVVEADLDAPAIVDIEPCVETFLPAGPGKVASFFTIRWKTADGDRYSATVDSEYQLKHTYTLPGPHFRLVNFDTDHTDEHLRQEEVLVVINDFEAVGRSLASAS